MAKKPAKELEGENYAESQSKRKSEAVEETAPEQTTEEGWSKKDIAPFRSPPAKVKSKSRTQDVKIIEEGREFPDIDGNMVVCGKTGTFTTEYAEMLKKLKVAE